jgi:ABC-2 type transport system permease protein
MVVAPRPAPLLGDGSVTVFKNLRIATMFLQASVAAEMEYRLNFASAALSSVMTLAGSIFTLSMVFADRPSVAGWTWMQAMVVVGAFTALEGLQSCVMTPNRIQISEAVREGGLDFVLLKPIDSQFWMSVRNWSLWGVPNIVLGIGLMAYAGAKMDPSTSLARFALAMGLLALGAIILYALGFMLSTISIWFVKLHNITYAMEALLEAGRYPIAAYPQAYRVLFTFVIPVALMTTVPAQAIAGTLEPAWLGGAVLAAFGLLLASRWFWRFALRWYGSASS